jgi:hypothetical protein
MGLAPHRPVRSWPSGQGSVRPPSACRRRAWRSRSSPSPSSKEGSPIDRLTAAEQAELEQKLRAFEERRGAQIAV